MPPVAPVNNIRIFVVALADGFTKFLFSMMVVDLRFLFNDGKQLTDNLIHLKIYKIAQLIYATSLRA